jgi:hypothetical protein
MEINKIIENSFIFYKNMLKKNIRKRDTTELCQIFISHYTFCTRERIIVLQ